ncbi:MAG TPA: hypothetical protein PLO37_03135 [Candidatus Hydrogenedentes bacterium]|nr:hypothetical protein [Candidatus Hydrogenedentota bacterium]HPG65815.1 hypothetical protein [Candidatus Hydrogenedentota bacterium]
MIHVLAAMMCPFIPLAGFILHLAQAVEPVTFDLEAARGIRIVAVEPIVPGPGLPSGLEILPANNNLDITRFDEDYFLAFRTAPTHFASSRARLIVVRSKDREVWTEEAQFQLEESDLREPRFLVFQGKLFLYFFRAGNNPFDFEPQGIHVTERIGPGDWTEPKPIFRPGFVNWRVKARNGLAYMSTYYGAGIYTTADRTGEVRLLTSTDGYEWTPIAQRAQETGAGAEETAFEFDEAGNLAAVIRLEVQGAKVCTACAGALADWQCEYTPMKYDSPLMFRHGSDFYVIARRNVAGPFYRGLTRLPERWQRAWYLARYSLTRKRTALYKVDLEHRRLVPLLDLPSKGDTAFAGIVKLDDRSYYVANYSSALDGPDWPWIVGQLRPTIIYGMILNFAEAG